MRHKRANNSVEPRLGRWIEQLQNDDAQFSHQSRSTGEDLVIEWFERGICNTLVGVGFPSLARGEKREALNRLQVGETLNAEVNLRVLA